MEHAVQQFTAADAASGAKNRAVFDTRATLTLVLFIFSGAAEFRRWAAGPVA